LKTIIRVLGHRLGHNIFDRLRGLYRRHVLGGLNQIYAEVARRRAVPTPIERVRAARTIRLWDSLTVVPRHGFASVDAYYQSMSVGPRLAELAVPALLVQAHADPMVPGWTYERHVDPRPPALELRSLNSGGHVGFPRRLGLERQLVEWLIAR
jgi:predicted alpha/beta-fold hydrolase